MYECYTNKFGFDLTVSSLCLYDTVCRHSWFVVKLEGTEQKRSGGHEVFFFFSKSLRHLLYADNVRKLMPTVGTVSSVVHHGDLLTSTEPTEAAVMPSGTRGCCCFLLVEQ